MKEQVLPQLFGLALIFIFFNAWFNNYKKERKVQKQRKEWYKKYPPGTKLEIVTWKRKCTTQYEMNKNIKEREYTYYTVISPREYFIKQHDGDRHLWNWYMNNNGVLLLLSR